MPWALIHALDVFYVQMSGEWKKRNNILFILFFSSFDKHGAFFAEVWQDQEKIGAAYIWSRVGNQQNKRTQLRSSIEQKTTGHDWTKSPGSDPAMPKNVLCEIMNEPSFQTLPKTPSRTKALRLSRITKSFTFSPRFQMKLFLEHCTSDDLEVERAHCSVQFSTTTGFHFSVGHENKSHFRLFSRVACDNKAPVFQGNLKMHSKNQWRNMFDEKVSSTDKARQKGYLPQIPLWLVARPAHCMFRRKNKINKIVSDKKLFEISHLCSWK